ncbi:MAG: efflux RND transporter permease subunit, partial [Stellaceae bacterium]
VFREFAVTISMTILISGLVSLTLTPMLCSRLLKPHREGEKQFVVLRWSEAGFEKLRAGYEWMLIRVMRRRRTVLGITILSIVFSAVLFTIVPKGFFPSVDTGYLFAFTEGPQDASFQSMVEHQKIVAKIISDDPNVSDVSSIIGATNFSPALNNGRLFIQLKPRGERSLTADEVIQELRPKLATVPGMRTFLQSLQDIRLGGRLSKSTYQYTLQDADTDELYRYATDMEGRIAHLPGFQDVNSDLELRNRQAIVHVDTDKAASLGITVDQIRNTFYSAFGARQISTIYEPSDDYEVILELDKRFQQSPSDLSKIYLKSATGQTVPLGAVATIASGVGPVTVNHQGQLPSVTISFNLAPGVSLGAA